MFDFRNEESMKKFSEVTNNCEKLRNCFNTNLPPSAAFERFFKTLNNTFHLAFKKIRIRSGGNPSLARVGNTENKLREKADMEKVFKNSSSEAERSCAKNKLEQLEREIFELLSEKNAQIVIEQVACLDAMDGSFNQIGMWKVKKKLCPRPKDPPTAKSMLLGT